MAKMTGVLTDMKSRTLQEGNPLNRAFGTFLGRLLSQRAVVTEAMLLKYIPRRLSDALLLPTEQLLFIPMAWDSRDVLRYHEVRFAIEDSPNPKVLMRIGDEFKHQYLQFINELQLVPPIDEYEIDSRWIIFEMMHEHHDPSYYLLTVQPHFLCRSVAEEVKVDGTVETENPSAPLFITHPMRTILDLTGTPTFLTNAVMRLTDALVSGNICIGYEQQLQARDSKRKTLVV